MNDENKGKVIIHLDVSKYIKSTKDTTSWEDFMDLVSMFQKIPNSEIYIKLTFYSA